jgi:hypothetical protein
MPAEMIDRLPFTIYGGNVFIFHKLYTSKNERAIVIKKINYKTGKIKNIYLKMNEFDNTVYWPNDIFCNKKHFYILFGRSLAVFKKFKKSIIFDTLFHFSESFQHLYVNNDTSIFIFKYYNYHPKSTRSKVAALIFNGGKISDTLVNINYIEGVELTHFRPIQLIDMYKDNIVLSKSSEYQVKIKMKGYNTYKTFKIERKPKYWKEIPKNIFKKYKNHHIPARKTISDFMKYVKGDYSYIRLVKFLNDSLLIVGYLPNNKKLKEKKISFIDFWKFNNDQWSCVAEDCYDGIVNNKITKRNFPKNLVYDPIKIYKNKIFSIKLIPPYRFWFSDKSKKRNISEEIEKYYEGHDLSFQLVIYDYDI